MKSVAELLIKFTRENPKAKVTDVYDDKNDILVRVLYNGRADFYFVRKSDGKIRAYNSGSEIARVSMIMQNNKRISIQNEE